MGVYDFFKGICPRCSKALDEHPTDGKFGDIQTKMFITDDDCFRSFYPGMRVPCDPLKEEIIIGHTCCCNTIIKACFDGTLLVGYKTLTTEEKRNYVNTLSEWQKKYINTEDLV